MPQPAGDVRRMGGMVVELDPDNVRSVLQGKRFHLALL